MEECIIKKTSSLGTIIIKEVPKKVAKELIVANHYSHKWLDSSFGKFNYGIFREEEPDGGCGLWIYEEFQSEDFYTPKSRGLDV